MAERGLTGRLKKGLLTGLLASSLALGTLGCGSSSAPTPPRPPPAPTPSYSQTATLENDVKIKYGANFSDMNNPVRSITHNSTQFGNDFTIPTSPYSETFNDLQKGSYVFTLSTTTPNVSPITVSEEVPNYNPTADSNYVNSLETDINECSQIILNLGPAFSDRNPEDNPVPINSVTSLDGRTQVSFSGYDVPIQAPCGTSPGTYQVNIEYGSSAGGLENTVLTGEILAVPDQIAFWSNRGGNEDIHLGDLINNQLTNTQRLTTDPLDDLEPAWSPNGKKIAFTTNREDVNGDGLRDNSIYTMNADGSNQTRLTPNIEHARQPSWSPDGSKIAFTYVDSGLMGIASINTDGTGFTRLVEEPVGGALPGWSSWSPDGSKIAFMTHRDNNWEIYSMNTDGGNQTNITNNSALDQQPRWSPDGQQIAFFSDRDTSPGAVPELNLYLMNPNGLGLERITDFSGNEFDLSWFSDSSKFVFAREISIGDPLHIYIMNTDGSGLTQLTTEGQNRYPAWRPRLNQP